MHCFQTNPLIMQISCICWDGLFPVSVQTQRCSPTLWKQCCLLDDDLQHHGNSDVHLLTFFSTMDKVMFICWCPSTQWIHHCSLADLLHNGNSTVHWLVVFYTIMSIEWWSSPSWKQHCSLANVLQHQGKRNVHWLLIFYTMHKALFTG